MNKLIAILSFLFLTLISFSQELENSIFYTDSLFSNSLGEYRKMNIYLPETYEKGKSFPIVYATDGMEIKYQTIYKQILDSLIHFKLIQPIIYVESYSSEVQTKEWYTIGTKPDTIYRVYREFDYVESSRLNTNDSLIKQRFSNHLTYFTDEFITSIEKKFSLPNNKMNRYFYGYSNGAGFGVNMMNKKPEIIGTYICFSTLGSSIESLKWKKKVTYPQIFLEYGDEEHSTLSDEANLAMKHFKKHHIQSQLTVFQGGHDQRVWPIEFAHTLEVIFGSKQ